jgi:hypothetical protein
MARSIRAPRRPPGDIVHVALRLWLFTGGFARIRRREAGATVIPMSAATESSAAESDFKPTSSW